MSKRFIGSLAAIAAMLAMLAGSMVGGTAVAQSGTPGVTEDSVPRPNHIHSGTCGDELGDVVFPLTDLSGATIQGSPVASPIVEDAATPEVTTGEVVVQGITNVDVALDDILADDHAINVHNSADDMGTYIACGNITGEPTDGELEIELDELNDSGFSGGAILTDNGDGTTTVTVTLVDQSDAVGTPAS